LLFVYDVRLIGAEPDVDWRDVLPWSPLHPLTVVQLEAPAEDVLPLGHTEHEVELVPPVLERYVPTAHAMQFAEATQVAIDTRPHWPRFGLFG
jgi:hypothetical protein